MQPDSLRFLVAHQIRPCSLQECQELCLVSQPIARSVVLQDSKQTVARAMQHTSQSAMLMAMIKDVVVLSDWQLAYCAQPALFRQQLLAYWRYLRRF